MTDQPALAFTIVGERTEMSMPDSLDFVLTWRLSGIPDGQWETDFASSSPGPSKPSVTGSTILWIVEKDQRERAQLFVEQQLIHANRLLAGRKLALG